MLNKNRNKMKKAGLLLSVVIFASASLYLVNAEVRDTEAEKPEVVEEIKEEPEKNEDVEEDTKIEKDTTFEEIEEDVKTESSKEEEVTSEDEQEEEVKEEVKKEIRNTGVIEEQEVEFRMYYKTKSSAETLKCTKDVIVLEDGLVEIYIPAEFEIEIEEKIVTYNLLFDDKSPVIENMFRSNGEIVKIEKEETDKSEYKLTYRPNNPDLSNGTDINMVYGVEVFFEKEQIDFEPSCYAKNEITEEEVDLDKIDSEKIKKEYNYYDIDIDLELGEYYRISSKKYPFAQFSSSLRVFENEVDEYSRIEYVHMEKPYFIQFVDEDGTEIADQKSVKDYLGRELIHNELAEEIEGYEYVETNKESIHKVGAPVIVLEYTIVEEDTGTGGGVIEEPNRPGEGGETGDGGTGGTDNPGTGEGGTGEGDNPGTGETETPTIPEDDTITLGEDDIPEGAPEIGPEYIELETEKVPEGTINLQPDDIPEGSLVVKEKDKDLVGAYTAKNKEEELIDSHMVVNKNAVPFEKKANPQTSDAYVYTTGAVAFMIIGAGLVVLSKKDEMIEL